MPKLPVRSTASLLVCAVLLAGAGPSTAKAEPALYDRLGGAYPIAVVVDDFIDRLLENRTLNANPAIDEARERVSREGLKYHVTSFVIQATGGPEVYVGRGMQESHAHLDITEREWRAMLAELRAVLYAHNVPEAEQDELIALVETVKGDVVSATQ